MNRLWLSVVAILLACGSVVQAVDAPPKMTKDYVPGNYKGLDWGKGTIDAALKQEKPVLLFVYMDKLDGKVNNIAYNIEIRAMADDKAKDALKSVTMLKFKADNKSLPAACHTTKASLFILGLDGRAICQWVDTDMKAADLATAIQTAVTTVDQQKKKGITAKEPVQKTPDALKKTEDPKKTDEPKKTEAPPKTEEPPKKTKKIVDD